MKRYNLIFLRDNKVLLSQKAYVEWHEIQEEYDYYMASLDFDTLQELTDYICMDYKLTPQKAKQEVEKLLLSNSDCIELKI